ncbi:Hypothetical predicted protein [Octopus vulgaris]|uniref:Uncharacterized protein n=1 Tax=Octopus vulgaris TaxID=6645 RepID=A0AA36BIV2_OCTVU|nr:Hypothetical predicted protein [Octopus vulgaris]
MEGDIDRGKDCITVIFSLLNARSSNRYHRQGLQKGRTKSRRLTRTRHGGEHECCSFEYEAFCYDFDMKPKERNTSEFRYLDNHKPDVFARFSELITSYDEKGVTKEPTPSRLISSRSETFIAANFSKSQLHKP